MMRKHRFSVEQFVAALKQTEVGTPVADFCRKLGVSEPTCYRWKRRCGSVKPDRACELKQLQEMSARLKKLVANLSLDKAIMRNMAAKNGAARAESR